MGRMITTREAAGMMGLQPKTLVDKRQKEGPRFLPFYKIGRAVRYDEDEVLEKIKASRVAPAAGT